MFYDKFMYLCNKKMVTPSRAAIEAGISKSLVTKWKTNKTTTPSPDILQKLSAYFNVSVGYLLGENEEKEKSPDQLELTEGEVAFIKLLRRIPAEDRPIAIEKILSELDKRV